MGLIRLLIYIFLIWLAVSFFKRLLHPPAKSSTKKHSSHQVESFVACHKCGLHIPQQEAIERDGHYYCCQAHRDS